MQRTTEPLRARVAGALLAVLVLILITPRAHAQGEADAGAALDGPRTVTLPAPADAVTPAGGGRYLLLRLDKLAKLAIYDVAEDKIKGYIPLGSTDTLVAGGAEKIVLVMTRTGPQFFSLQTLKPLDLHFAQPNGMSNWHPHGSVMHVAASADGQSFSGWYRGVSPSGLRLIRVQGNTIVGRHVHDGAGALLPSWDGSQLYTANGVYSADLKPLAPEHFRQKACIPVYRPGYFLTTSAFDPHHHHNNGGNPKPGTPLSLYTASDRALLVTLPPLKEVTTSRDAYYGAPGTLQWHERVFLVPQHGRLVTVADTRDHLVVRPFDLMAALNNAGIDYLFVDSLPVTAAHPGRAYRYPITVKSKKGGIKFTLDSGPDGMTLSKDGVLSWNVPANAEAGPAGVIVTVEDSASQNVFHTFNVQVAEGARPGGTAKKIQLGPESNQWNGSGGRQPPVVRAVKKPSKGTSSAKTE